MVFGKEAKKHRAASPIGGAAFFGASAQGARAIIGKYCIEFLIPFFIVIW
jgi:hypothetical protein